MVKHRFDVIGFNDDGRVFNSICIAYQIEDACKLYREQHLHLKSVIMKEQVNANTDIGINTIE